MKKSIIFTIIFSLSLNAFAASTSVSDIVLFNDIKLSYATEYYPGAIDKISQLQKEFPDSAFIPEALLLKGISYFHIQRYDSSIESLEKALSLLNENDSLRENALFALGRTYYFANYYEMALGTLHECCEVYVKNQSEKKDAYYYSQSILYSAKSFYKINDYKSAIPLYEYVVQNGVQFSPSDYNDSLQKLCLCYNNCELYEKTTSLFSKLEQLHLHSPLSSDLYYLLCLYNADAYKNLGKNKTAYDYYCTVIECGNEQLAIQGLKKAYILSSEANIGVNPGEVFSKSTQTFATNPELVKEFWIRLGIDEYNAKNYAKSTEYFENVNATEEEQDYKLVTLYKAKILIDWKGDYKKAEEILLSINHNVGECDIQNFSDSYYSVLLQTKYLQKKWSEMPAIYGKISTPSEQAIYAISAYYYNAGDYKNVDSSTGELYASALCKMGKYAEACKVFSNLGVYSCDYANALFACGRYQDCYDVAQKTSDVQKEYLCGIAQINLKNWDLARTHFSSYIKLNSGKANFNKFSFFYKGYAEYSLEEYKNSYASFVRYGSEAGEKENRYKRQGYEYAAKSALQNGDLKSAALQAENVVKASVTEQERQNAVIFSAEIFSDAKEYDRAISVLSPYINKKDEFGAHALFLTAMIYNRKGDLKSADSYFQRITKEHSRSAYSEEAMFRTGEIFYANEDYVNALNRFTNYIYQYADGKFGDAALYFGGECALRLGENDRTIMLTTTMLKKYENSTYTYGANKNLLTAYSNMENYNSALEVAKLLVKEFPTQASDDQIGKKLINLEKLVNGVDKRVVDLQEEFEKNKGSSTKKGRIAGSKLVQIYANSTYTQKEAYDLATELLEKQKANDERLYAANNAEVIADYYRKNNENKKAAQMYLKAAEYYRSVENSDDVDGSAKAAVVLYGAVEAFMAEQLQGDAQQTAQLLQSLYPESRQAQRVERLFE